MKWTLLRQNCRVPSSTKNIVFLKYYTSIILKFTVFANVPKMSIKIKTRHENSTIYQISFKKVQPLQKIIIKLFPKLEILYVSAGQRTTLTGPKELFCFRITFDRCQIRKNWNPPNWFFGLIYQYIPDRQECVHFRNSEKVHKYSTPYTKLMGSMSTYE